MRAKPTEIFRRAFAERMAKYRHCERGVTAIEFAFVAPIIIAILLATLQVAVIVIAQSYLEELAESGMRIVLTNNAYTLTQSQFQSAICAKITALFSCNNLLVQLGSAPTTPAGIPSMMPSFNPVTGNLNNPLTYSTGTQGTKMMLIVMYQWPVVSGPLGLTFASLANGTRLLISTQIFYKEPCLNANGC